MDILQTTEAAGESLVNTLGLSGVNVYTGIDNETKAAPCVIISAESATEEIIKSQIYKVKTNLVIKEMAADTDVSSNLSQTIFSAFIQSGIESILSSQTPNYSVLFVSNSEPVNTEEGDAWKRSMTLDIVCGLTA